ncbi:MAG TPA: adenylate/guanylate cyclase domain-containing protein [Solirubrobacterales bacterium]|nr:adenylate/guanylate cyclase domain-containing protein [Solirubrobacterales bacterium]
MPTPKTSYAKSGDVNIAYQELGEGPPDLIYVWGWASHLDFQWTDPTLSTFLKQLASFSRLIMFDKRGTGLSDPVGAAPTFDERMDDIRAVMDAAGSKQATLLGFSEGAALASLFAASHPERATSLVFYDSVVVGSLVEDPPASDWFAEAQRIRDTIDRWGEGETLEWIAPSIVSPVTKRFMGMFERASMSPGMALALWDAIQHVDVRDVLPSIAVPTLVLHHAESAIPVDQGRLIAELVPQARFVELPGRDHLPGAGDPEAVAGEIEEFVTGTRARLAQDRVLATVLFTDIVDSTRRAADLGDSAWRDLLERHDAVSRTQITRFGGREVKHTGDGFMATFDGPARAIRCACAIAEETHEVGIDVRAGIHTGECQKIGDDIGGLAVHVAARVAALADGTEVLVSGTVKDLVMGSGIEFAERGTHELKGVPGSWPVLAVRTDLGEVAGATTAPSVEPRPAPGVGDRAAQRLARSAPWIARGISRARTRR